MIGKLQKTKLPCNIQSLLMFKEKTHLMSQQKIVRKDDPKYGSKRKLKVVAVSDTHGHNDYLLKMIEDKQSGDIFLHGGDFTRYGKDYDFQNFISILKKLDFKHKIVIAGNHEIMLDQNINQNHKERKLDKYPCKYTKDQIVKMLKQHCIYLQHEPIQVEGINIFGSPYVKKYGKSAFQYDHQLDDVLWKQVPKVDILLTHSPPYGILDRADSGFHGGSEALRKRVFQIKPKYHLFGHIHQSRGNYEEDGIKFMNLARRIVRFDLQI